MFNLRKKYSTMTVANDSTINMSFKQTVPTVYNYGLFSLIPPLTLMMYIKMEGVHRSTFLSKIAAVLS